MKTILVVDDTEENIDILVGLLKDYDVLVALDALTAIEIAKAEHVDLILMDILMPGVDGFEACQRLKACNDTLDIPIIFITAKTDEDSIEHAYSVGGLDYVTKPFKPKELLARVKTQLQLKELIEHLEQLSSYDAMTGVFNRRKFFELANQCFIAEKDDLFCVMLDIDKFKLVNDKYGHDVGDRVIKMVANTVQRNIPANATFGRLGGEEFALLHRSSNANAIKDLTEGLRLQLCEQKVPIDDSTDVSVTVSFGIAHANPEHTSIDELLKSADLALYEAKGSGRNKSIFRT